MLNRPAAVPTAERPATGARAPTRANQQETHSGFDSSLFSGRPVGDLGGPALVIGTRHAATGSMTQLLSQKRQDPVEGDPGWMPRLVNEGDREHRVRRRRDASRVARRRVDLDPLEGCPERRPQRLEPLRRATPVVAEPEPEHAQAVIRSFHDCGEILSIQAQGGTATLPDWRGHVRLAHDGRDDRRFERCRQRETSGEAHPDHPDPGTATLTVGRRCECPQPPDDGARAVGQLRELPRHADPQDRSHDLAAIRRRCGAPEQRRQVHGVPSGDEPTGEIDDARMQAGISWSTRTAGPEPPRKTSCVRRSCVKSNAWNSGPICLLRLIPTTPIHGPPSMVAATPDRNGERKATTEPPGCTCPNYRTPSTAPFNATLIVPKPDPHRRYEPSVTVRPAQASLGSSMVHAGPR
jgi:hypothetical protein